MNGDKKATSAWDAMLGIMPAMLSVGLGIYGHAKAHLALEEAKKGSESMFTGVLEDKEPAPTSLLVVLLPEGSVQLTLEGWAERTDVWLRGLTVEDLVERARWHRSKNGAWGERDPADIVLVPATSSLAQYRIDSLWNPPKGKKGAQALRHRGEMLRLVRESWLDLVDAVRRGQRQRDTLRSALLETEKALVESQLKLKASEERLVQLEAQVAPHGELSALFGWWSALRSEPTNIVYSQEAARKMAPVIERVHDLLGRMFDEPPAPKR